VQDFSEALRAPHDQVPGLLSWPDPANTMPAARVLALMLWNPMPVCSNSVNSSIRCRRNRPRRSRRQTTSTSPACSSSRTRSRPDRCVLPPAGGVFNDLISRGLAADSNQEDGPLVVDRTCKGNHRRRYPSRVRGHWPKGVTDDAEWQCRPLLQAVGGQVVRVACVHWAALPGDRCHH
jgi:hypothetical protein